jgi:hypothetical protein
MRGARLAMQGTATQALLLLAILATACAWQPAMRAPGSVVALQQRGICRLAEINLPPSAPAPAGCGALQLGMQWGGGGGGGGGGRGYDRGPREFGGGGGRGYDRGDRRDSRGGGGGEVRPGDWTCDSCGATVFASKDECYRCGAPKPYNARPAQAGAGGRGRERGMGGGGRRDMGPWCKFSKVLYITCSLLYSKRTRALTFENWPQDTCVR